MCVYSRFDAPMPADGRRAGARALPWRTMTIGLAIVLFPLAACTAGNPAEPAADAAVVEDLSVTGATDSTLTLEWTEVEDGTGGPASYAVRYASPPIDWETASPGCEPTLAGQEVGRTMSCTIGGLEAETTYEIELTSFRLVREAAEGIVHSNVARGNTAAERAGSDTTTATTTDTIPGTIPDTIPDTTSAVPPSPDDDGPGIWIGRTALARLPTSGPAWQNLLSEANGSCGTPDLSDQNQTNNVCIMAKALVFARTGEVRYRADVVDALRRIVNAPTYRGRALALGRELAAYVISADLIDLHQADPSLDADFRTTIRGLLTTRTEPGPANLVECHERRPNNWGTHCGASRAAVAAYLGDEAQLARVAQVFRGWLGDRDAYSGFDFGDLSWQCDPEHPVGINPAGCTRDGHSLDGVLPDDERRAGAATWPPPKENYVWEALQGALVQAVILQRAGYPVFEWQNEALLRAARWLHSQAGYPAEGDDTWLPHLLNHFYGTDFPAPIPAQPGKNAGWTDWTHGR